MNKVFFCLVSAVLMTIAEAATPTFTVSWVAPTTFIDNTPLGTAAITYQLYVGPSGAEVKYGNPVTSPPYVISPTPAVGKTTCVQVTSIVNGVESAKPTEVCGTVPFAQPNTPSATTITIK